MHLKPREIDQIIGKNIVVRRKIFKMDQNVLAGVLKTSPEQVKGFEEGTLTLSAHQLFTLARFFNCSIDALCGYHPIDESFCVSLVSVMDILSRELPDGLIPMQIELQEQLLQVYKALKILSLSVNVAHQKLPTDDANLKLH